MEVILFFIGIIISVGFIGYILGANFRNLPEGSKGITKPYTSKSGVKRTAKKEREEHIV